MWLVPAFGHAFLGFTAPGQTLGGHCWRQRRRSQQAGDEVNGDNDEETTRWAQETRKRDAPRWAGYLRKTEQRLQQQRKRPGPDIPDLTCSAARGRGPGARRRQEFRSRGAAPVVCGSGLVVDDDGDSCFYVAD